MKFAGQECQPDSSLAMGKVGRVVSNGDPHSNCWNRVGEDIEPRRVACTPGPHHGFKVNWDCHSKMSGTGWFIGWTFSLPSSAV